MAAKVGSKFCFKCFSTFLDQGAITWKEHHQIPSFEANMKQPQSAIRPSSPHYSNFLKGFHFIKNITTKVVYHLLLPE